MRVSLKNVVLSRILSMSVIDSVAKLIMRSVLVVRGPPDLKMRWCVPMMCMVPYGVRYGMVAGDARQSSHQYQLQKRKSTIHHYLHSGHRMNPNG